MSHTPRTDGTAAAEDPDAAVERTPAPAVGETVVVDVGDPVAGGQCIARLDGRVVFVRDGIPGERVTVRITGAGKRGAFLRGDVVEVETPSEHRVEPPCALAYECGGCDWQFIDLAFQRKMKAHVIADALRRTGGIESIAGQPLSEAVVVEEVVTEDIVTEDIVTGEVDANAGGSTDGGADGLHWRSRMRYAVDEDGNVGLRAARSHRIIPAADCPLAVHEIAAAVPRSVSLGEREDERDGARDAVIAVASHTGQVKVVGPNADVIVTERVRDRTFEVAATGFWQVHPQAPETLVGTVLDFAAPQHGEKVLDLYSGVGLFAAFLAEAVGVTGRVDAVEGDKTASRLSRANLADLVWAHHHRAPVERWLAGGHRSHADIVVLDPPRSGAGRAVVTAAARRKPRSIVYVACDPVALARDAKYLSALGYKLIRLRAFDLFPMTKHVEAVALFTRD